MDGDSYSHHYKCYKIRHLTLQDVVEGNYLAELTTVQF